MTVLTVLDSPELLSAVTDLLRAAAPEAEHLAFDSSLRALAAARGQEIDIAVIDTALPELRGLDLGRYLRELYPNVNLIYLSEDREAGFEALRQHASGILPKPPGAEEMRRELEDLRYPQTQKERKRLFAQTFGNFEFFVDGKPVSFKYSRTKEILALFENCMYGKMPDTAAESVSYAIAPGAKNAGAGDEDHREPGRKGSILSGPGDAAGGAGCRNAVLYRILPVFLVRETADISEHENCCRTGICGNPV